MNELPYRQGTNIYLIDKNNNFLILQKANYGPNEWELVGGGLDPDEDPLPGALREIKEELGIDEQDLEILTKSDKLYTFEWPEQVTERHFKKSGVRYQGQQKHQFLLRFTGDKDSVQKQDDEI